MELAAAAAVAGASRWHTFRAIRFRCAYRAYSPPGVSRYSSAFASSINLLAPWSMNQYDQGHRAEALAMTLIGVGTSTVVLVAVRVWQAHKHNV